MSPAVDTGEGKIDPLRDVRLTGDLYKQSMEHCMVTPWSLGQEGEEKHKLKRPVAIATNSRGQFIVADYYYDIRLMVFDSRGAFINNLVMIRMPDGVNQVQRIFDIASDMKDSVYVSVKLYNIKTGKLKFALYKFNFTSDYIYQFPLKETCHYDWLAMTVMDSGQMFVAGKCLEGNDEIDVYGTDGQLVRSFGKGLFTSVLDNTAVNDGRVMLVDDYDNNVHIFSEHGDHLNKFKLEGYFPHPRIEFHESSDYLIVACVESSKNRLHVRIYTKDGVFVQSTQIHVESAIGSFLKGIAVTADGHIATVVKARDNRFMVLVV